MEHKFKYDFETYRPRWNMGSGKWDPLEKSKFPKEELVPFSTADMELMTAPSVHKACIELAKFGMFGYTGAYKAFDDAVLGWMDRRHGWKAKSEWMRPFGGVVAALFTIVRAYTEPGDSVIIQTPVYFPFHAVVTNNKRKLVYNELKIVNGRYEMDYEDLEEKAKSAKMLILCSPHNPTGRVWEAEELRRLGEICNKYGVVVVADEIHHDLVYAPHRHTMYPLLGEEFENNCVLCTSASKTFSIAGFNTSTIFIPNAELRKRFDDQCFCDGAHYNGCFGPMATVAAYNDGAEWVDELVLHLRGNFEYFRDFMAEKFPAVTVYDLEGTYLAWFDCRSFGMDDNELKSFMQDEAGMYLDAGFIFGACGSGFERINLACPRKPLAAALDRLYTAAKKRGIIE